MFSGMALGPTVGSLLIRATGFTLSVFYLATATHILYTFLVFFIIPESLTRKQMALTKEKYEAEGGAAAADRGPVSSLVKLRRLFAFLSPLTIFMPYEIKGEGMDVNPLKKPKKDWNLTFMALAYASIISIAVSLGSLAIIDIFKFCGIHIFSCRDRTPINSNTQRLLFHGRQKR
jgi:MFS family permease